MKKESVFLSALFFLLIVSDLLHAQEWKFIKEKDGIKIYTRSDENSPVKAYKGETYINTSMGVLSRIIEDVEGFKDWDKDIEQLEVFEYIKDSLIRYYIVYKVQWPFDKRDLYVEAKISQDALTGKRTVFAVGKEGVVDEKPGIVRLKNYWQRWTLEPAGDGRIHLIQEGSVDPGGAIPAWLANMVITDTPLKIMQNVKEVVARQ
jgi:hypothetical protein